MNIFTLDLSEVSQENIYLMDPKKNILMDGTFSKMIYVHSFFSMNGVYINIPIKIHKIENYSFSNKSLLSTKPTSTTPSVKQTIFFTPFHISNAENVSSLSLKPPSERVELSEKNYTGCPSKMRNGANEKENSLDYSPLNHSNVHSYISMLELLEKQILEQYVPLDPNLLQSFVAVRTEVGLGKVVHGGSRKQGSPGLASLAWQLGFCLPDSDFCCSY